MSTMALASSASAFASQNKGEYDDKYGKISANIDKGYSEYTAGSGSFVSKYGLPFFIHYAQKKFIPKDTSCGLDGLMWNPFCWIQIYYYYFWPMKGNPMLYVPFLDIAQGAAKKFKFPPCIPIINPCPKIEWSFPEEHFFDVELNHAWFVNNLELIWFSAPQEIKVDYRLDGNLGKLNDWYYLVDWTMTNATKGFGLNLIFLGLLLKFIPPMFFIIVLLIAVIMFLLLLKPKFFIYNPTQDLMDQTQPSFYWFPRPMKALRIYMRGSASINIAGIDLAALHNVIPSCKPFNANLRLFNPVVPQLCFVAPFFMSAFAEVIPCETLLDKYPEQYMLTISAYKISFQNKKNGFLMALSYGSQGVELGKYSNCSDCEYEMWTPWHIGMMNNRSKCLGADYHMENDVGQFVLEKDIFVSSSMDGVFSELCINADEWTRFKKNKIDYIYEIDKKHVFSKGASSWISGLGDQYVLFGFNLNKMHSIILKYITIGFTYAPGSFKVMCLNFGYPSNWEDVYYVKRNEKKFHIIDLGGRACETIQIMMFTFDPLLSKMKRQCNGSDMLVYGINRIQLFRLGHPVKMVACSMDENSEADAWLLLPEPASVPYFRTNTDNEVEASYNAIAQLNKTGYKNLSIIKKTTNDVIYEAGRLTAMSSNTESIVLQTRAGKDMLEPLKSCLAQAGAGERATAGENESVPAVSCFHVYQAKPTRSSGFYWVQPVCAPKAFKTYCNLSTPRNAYGLLVESVRKLTLDQVKGNFNDPVKLDNICKSHGLSWTYVDIDSPQKLQESILMSKLNGFDQLDENMIIPYAYDFNCDKECTFKFKQLNSKEKFNAYMIMYNKKVNYSSRTYTQAEIKMLNSVAMREGGLQTLILKEYYIQAVSCSDNGRYLEFLKGNCTDALSLIAKDLGPGASAYIACPDSCGPAPAGVVYGDQQYANLSNPCLAGIQSDTLIKSAYGRVAIINTYPPLKEYASADRNGVKSLVFVLKSSYMFKMEQINCGKRKRELNLMQIKQNSYKSMEWLDILNNVEINPENSDSEEKVEKDEKDRSELYKQQEEIDKSTLAEYNKFVQHSDYGKNKDKNTKNDFFDHQLESISSSFKEEDYLQSMRFDGFQPATKEDKGAFEKNSKGISKPYMKPGYYKDPYTDSVNYIEMDYGLKQILMANSKLDLTLDMSCTDIEFQMKTSMLKLDKYAQIAKKAFPPIDQTVAAKFPFVYSIGVTSMRYASQISRKINTKKESVQVMKNYLGKLSAFSDYYPTFAFDETFKVTFISDFTEITNMFARNKPARWEFLKKDIAPHSGALGNVSTVSSPYDDATLVVTKYQQIYDGSIGMSVKMENKSKFAIMFRYTDLFNYYSFGLDFAKSEIYVDKYKKGIKTRLATKPMDLKVKQFYRVHIELVRNNFKFKVFTEKSFWFKNGKYTEPETKVLNMLKIQLNVFDASFNYGRFGWKCSDCSGAMVAAVKKVNFKCNAAMEGNIYINRTSTSRFIWNKAREFKDVFNMFFHKEIKEKQINVTRLLKTLGYKNLNLIQSDLSVENETEVPVIFYPKNMSTYFCKNNCVYSFEVKIVKYEKFVIYTKYQNNIQNIEFMWNTMTSDFSIYLNSMEFLKTVYNNKIDLIILNQVNLIEIIHTVAFTKVLVNKQIIYDNSNILYLNKQYKDEFFGKKISSQYGSFGIGCQKCKMYLVDATLKPIRSIAKMALVNLETKIGEVIEGADSNNNKKTGENPASEEQSTDGSTLEEKKELQVSKYAAMPNVISTYSLAINEGMLKRKYKYSSVEDLKLYNVCTNYFPLDIRKYKCVQDFYVDADLCADSLGFCSLCCRHILPDYQHSTKLLSCTRLCWHNYRELDRSKLCKDPLCRLRIIKNINIKNKQKL